MMSYPSLRGGSDDIPEGNRFVAGFYWDLDDENNFKLRHIKITGILLEDRYWEGIYGNHVPVD